jgi:hypothetical protein
MAVKKSSKTGVCHNAKKEEVSVARALMAIADALLRVAAALEGRNRIEVNTPKRHRI